MRCKESASEKIRICSARAELTSSEWHDFGSRQSRFAVTMKAEVEEENHKVFLWTSGNRFKLDVAKTKQITFFCGPQALSFLLVLAGNMQSKVFRVKRAHFEEARLAS